MKSLIAKYRVSELARNTGWMLFGEVIALLTQAIYFIIIARNLGAQQYGAFVAAVAVPQILSPFVGFGASSLLVKNVAQDRNLFAVYWGNLILITLASGLAFSTFVITLARLILPVSIPLLLIVFVTVADLIFYKLIDGAARAFQGIRRLNMTAQLHVWPVLARCVGIVVLAMSVDHPTALDWSFVYLVTTMFVAALGVALVHTKISKPSLDLGRIRSEFVQGLYFSTSLSAQSIYNDIDKAMLSRMASLHAVGIYATAYRVIDVAFTPISALLYAGYSDFFRAGQAGLQGALSYMRRLLPRSAGFSLLVVLCLIISAPVIPYIFGPEFEQSVEALRWLSLLPLLKSIHFFLADTLTCSGHQGYRTLIQVMVAGFNALINLWLIPAYSWRGAAWSSLASDFLLMALLYFTIRFLRAKRVYVVNKSAASA